jgi:hypothetical protein
MAKCEEKWANLLGFKTEILSICEMLLPTKILT